MPITDEMLTMQAGAARDLWLSTLPDTDTLPELPCSPDFEKRMDKLRRKAQYTALCPSRLRLHSRRALIAILLLLLLTFGSLLTVQAYRHWILDMIREAFDDYTHTQYTSALEEAEDIVMPDLLFVYLPNDLERIEDHTALTGDRLLLYTGINDRFFELHQMPVGENGSYHTLMNTRDAETGTMMLGQREIFYIIKNDHITMEWTVDNIVYTLFGNLPADELRTIAENIILIKNPEK